MYLAKTSSGVTDTDQVIHIKLTEKYEHFLQAIHGYRETERLHWNPQNTGILQRARDVAFPPGTSQLSLVHVLDLAVDGVIKPHIDSVRVSLYFSLMVG
jgi:alkylated DNA repair protein alkB family protein 7